MDDARPKMCYRPSPPPSSRTIFSSYLNFDSKCSSDHIDVYDTSRFHCPGYQSNYIGSTKDQDNMQRTEDIKNVNDTEADEETASDYKQWLHAMKLVARLPGGIPPEFRRKLWLSLADKYLKSKNVDWAKEEEKCFREKWREDDEELGIQIVKDLHRTGSTLCTGPSGDLNQAKLKKILLGYSRYNPEVGYCQGFNMLGALILQVMDKDESGSIKVMIYLVEGILPAGYFCGSMGGLQADMAVFRELMQTKLPRLAKHLQKLQGPIENAYEPPLTNVFTMQWFLTMFCTCLPMSCVLRVWDLVLIEGSDVLLRTALALWSLLEEKVLSARSADDFYGKMVSFSSELLNGHLIDSNGLIEKVVQLGPISDIEKLREKHLCNVAPLERQQDLQLYFDDDEPDMDESSRLAIATIWGIPWGRRASQGHQNNNVAKHAIENKDRIALDISLLKKQYDKLRERQKQAQIILTTACSSASRQNTTTTPLPVNQLLSGRPAIVTNKGRRYGPPTGAIPPARKPSLPAVLHDKQLEKQLRRDETLLWRDAKETRSRRDSLSWKEIKAERAALISSGSVGELKSRKIRTGRLGKSDSSSYSEESDDNDNKICEDASSSDTSLDDEDLQANSNGKQLILKNEIKSAGKALYKSKKSSLKQRNQSAVQKNSGEKSRPKSWAPSNSEIPFILMTAESPNQSADENPKSEQIYVSEFEIPIYSTISDEKPTPLAFDNMESTATTDIPFLGDKMAARKNNETDTETFDISSEGVTNEYFERVNSTERPTKLDLFYSLNEDGPIREVFKIKDDELLESKEDSRFYANGNSLNKNNSSRCMDLLVDYSEKSSAACIEEAKTEISGFKNENSLRKTKTSAEKRRDPRRLTLTRSSTMDIEKRFEAFEKRFSMELSTSYTKFSDEFEYDPESNNKKLQPDHAISFKKTNNSRSRENIVSEKKIPTTADLEERFEIIQQQLVRDRNRMNNSPCDSESTEKQTNSKSLPDNNTIRSRSQKGESPKQPIKHDAREGDDRVEGKKVLNKNRDIEENSTAANEFKQVAEASSTQETQSDTVDTSSDTISETKLVQKKKEPPDENVECGIIERDNSNGKDVSGIAVHTTKIQEPSTSLSPKNESEKNTLKEPETVDETTDESHIASMKNSDRNSPPCTEELEKRFSALEEKLNSERSDAKVHSSDVSPKRPAKLAATSETVNKEDLKDIDNSNEDSSQVQFVASTKSADPKTSVTNSKFMTEKSTQRRLSEPPSTEDLERRYEVLKRRMSSRNFDSKSFHNDPAAGRHEGGNINSSQHDISKSSSFKTYPPSIKNLEERFEKLQAKNEPNTAVKMQSPPSTENLEERFEKLQYHNATKSQSPATGQGREENIKYETVESDKSNKGVPNLNAPTEKEMESNRIAKSVKQDESTSFNNRNHSAGSSKSPHNEQQASEEKLTSRDQQKVEDISKKRKTIDVLSKNANKIKLKLIEELQAKIKEHSTDANVDSSLQKKMAVIEELKSKTEPVSETFLRPTQISPRRRPPSQNTLLQSLSFNDETLESHATSANRKSGKHEHNSVVNRKMVRRFSDLPSRADLENRLQFLEEQLHKTVCMQRSASDSEVASKAHSKNKPSVSCTVSSDSLEGRIQELEKRLKDNRTISMDVECSSAKEKNDLDIEVSQVDLAADSVALTGKELVRYSSQGQVGEVERQNPINISINIQMTLNKEDIGMMKKAPEDSKADDLDKRLQILEKRLKTAADHLSCSDGENRERHTEKKQSEHLLSEDKANRTIHSTEAADNLSPEQFSLSQNRSTENTQSESFLKTDPSKFPENLEKSLEEKSEKAEENKISAQIETSVPAIKEDKQIESTKPEESETQKEEELRESKVEKADNIPEVKTKGNETVEPTETGDERSTIKTMENNPKDDKNMINALQKIPLTQPNETSEPQEAEPVAESIKSTIGKHESKTHDFDIKKEKIKNDESIATKTNSVGENFIGKGSQFVPIEVNKKTLVLLLDNEPKAVKVRRLTRANTEELEGLFQALEKQLNDREQQKISKTDVDKKGENEIDTSSAVSDLAKEISEFSKSGSTKPEKKDKPSQVEQKRQEEQFDWGTDPIKYHLKKRTVYLPSTKELEARFRSLERQIKLLEDVEKINVEHRLTEIERKIKLQYSLSHEKDLNKFLDLCEGKDPDEVLNLENYQDISQNTRNSSPSRLKEDSTHIEQHYRAPDLERSKLNKQSQKKLPIHPLEMLLDPSPDERNIPTTGELEHRIRVLEATRCSSSPPSRKSRSQSPPTKQAKTKSSTHVLDKMAASPTERELPTAEELEARLEALEREQSFNFKMQKDFQQFNKKLKDVISPSLSFDDIKSPAKSSDSVQTKVQSSSTLKQTKNIRAISPKTIRFHDMDTSQKEIEHKFSEDKEPQQIPAVREGLGVMGIRLMRETSPLRRKGTHTGVPLRTGENINDQLTSIQNTIKSIDSLCEEKPYRKERCQQYIDSLFSDSTYFAHKKASLEDLTSRNLSSSTSREAGPSIKISDHSPAFSRSMGSADSIRSASPLRSTSPLQYRSNRDLRRESSPRRRREEDREEHESRRNKESTKDLWLGGQLAVSKPPHFSSAPVFELRGSYF